VSNTSLTAYRAPDEVVVDAVYACENGGINPVRHHDWGWNANQMGKDNCIVRYERIRRVRSSYQGFWQAPEEATKGRRNGVH
jgi:hypothetical protein